MKRFLRLSILFFLTFMIGVQVNAQIDEQESVPVHPKEQYLTDPTRPLNFQKITSKTRVLNEQWRRLNKGYEQHPDAAYVPALAPTSSAIEILSKRTESTRYYVDADEPSKIYSQGALGALHYKKDNQWLAIDARLDKLSETTYEATHQPLPVGFEMANQYAYIRLASGKIRFNQWQLYGVNKQGKRILLSDANWDKITVGDDGLKVTNLFPGIDAEMQVVTGAIKTTFFLHHWEMGDLDELLLVDTYQKGIQSLQFYYDNIMVKKGRVAGEVLAKEGKNTVLQIGKAFMYNDTDPTASIDLPYEIGDQSLGIVLAKSDVITLLKNGPVIIDPLVQGREGRYAPTTPLNSFRTRDNAACDNYTYEASCSYSWTVPIPGGIEIISTTHVNNMLVMAPCTRDKMGFRIVLGEDLNCGPGILWYPEGRPTTPGGVGGSPNTITNYNNCLPVKCEESNLKVSLGILRACMGPAGCEAACVQGNGPFVMTVLGRTLEYVSIAPSIDMTDEVCPEDLVKLTARANYGLKPYTFQWNDGSKDVTKDVRPSKNTTYTVEIKDACQNKVNGSIEVKVKQPSPQPVLSLTTNPEEQVCAGQPIDMSAQVQGKGTFSYQWKVNGEDVANANALSWRSTSLKNNDQISFQVTVSERCFADYKVVSAEKSVSVFEQPVQEKINSIIGCNKVEYEGQTYLESTDLVEMLTSKSGCDSLRLITQIVVEDFTVDLVALTPLDIFEGQPVHLMVKSQSSNFNVVRWEPDYLFTDLTASEQRFVGQQSQTFVVHARSETNCISSDTLALKVNSASSILLMPTAFSPNGDQYNDLWEPTRLNDFPEGELFVYNRWGQCVYHAEDYTVAWDGKFNGTLVPSGVYSYRLIVPGRKEILGSVSVLY